MRTKAADQVRHINEQLASESEDQADYQAQFADQWQCSNCGASRSRRNALSIEPETTQSLSFERLETTEERQTSVISQPK